MSFDTHQFKKAAVAAARSASNKRADDILLFDLRRIQGSISDYLLIVSANSHVHLKTLREAICDSLGKHELVPIHKDGMRSDHWVALDYGGLLVHIMHEEARRFYSLERLWGDSRRVRWQSPNGDKKGKARRESRKKH